MRRWDSNQPPLDPRTPCIAFPLVHHPDALGHDLQTYGCMIVMILAGIAALHESRYRRPLFHLNTCLNYIDAGSSGSRRQALQSWHVLLDDVNASA